MRDQQTGLRLLKSWRSLPTEASHTNRTFEPRGYFTVPDGTDVSPFLNATDTQQTDVPWDALGDMSIASGRINPGVVSWIHYHPVLTQVTYVVSGRLVVLMRGARDPAPYSLELENGQAAITGPGTFFQVRNASYDVVEVLYIASPAYIFEIEGGRVLHDDAVLVAKSWEELPSSGVPAAHPTTNEAWTARRAEAKRRLAKRKGIQVP